MNPDDNKAPQTHHPLLITPISFLICVGSRSSKSVATLLSGQNPSLGCHPQHQINPLFLRQYPHPSNHQPDPQTIRHRCSTDTLRLPSISDHIVRNACLKDHSLMIDHHPLLKSKCPGNGGDFSSVTKSHLTSEVPCSMHISQSVHHWENTSTARVLT